MIRYKVMSLYVSTNQSGAASLNMRIYYYTQIKSKVPIK